MADSPQISRAAHPDGSDGDEQISVGPSLGGRRSRDLDEPESAGVFVPDFSGSPSSEQSGHQDSPRDANDCNSLGLVSGGEVATSNRPVGAEIQGPRGSPRRGGLADGTPSGTDSIELLRPHEGRGARDGNKSRTSIGEAERGLGESTEKQIGSRQRSQPRGKLGRESGEQKSLTESKGEPPKAGEPQEEPADREGKVRRGEDSQGSGGGGRPKSPEGPPPSGVEARREVERKRKRKKEGSMDSMVDEDEGRKKRRPQRGQSREGSPRAERHLYFEESGDEVEEEVVQGLLRWIGATESGGLTATQLGKHLLIQVAKSEGTFARVLMRSLEPPRWSERRERNLMPLPLWPDVVDKMILVLDEEKVKDQPGDWRARGSTKAKAGKVLRVEGLLIWTGLVVVGLNWLHSGGTVEASVPVRGGQASKAQEAALCRIWDMVKTFVDEKEERRGVPRSPMGEWENELEKLKVSYTGEICEKAQHLTLEQILPGLPSVDHGGLVDLCEVVDEKLASRLQKPELLIKKEIIDLIPSPKVMCEDEEWNKVVKALYDRKLVKPVNRCPVVDGKPVTNGAFGVVKQGKKTESGKDVLRMIFDLRATNSIMDQLQGDVGKLVGAAGFLKLTIKEGECLLVSGEDLTAAFYLFRLPPQWADFMVLEKEVPWDVFFPGKPGKTRVGISVLPMGWNSAVGIMQSAHRQIALRTPRLGGAGLSRLAEITKDSVFPDLEEAPVWTIYLDDTTIIEPVAKKVMEEIKGKPAEEQESLRRAYEWWGIPTNAGKALARVEKTERLGAVLDGNAGVLRGSTKRMIDLISLGTWLRSRTTVPTKALQIYAGKAVHLLQFRRCLLSVMERIFGEIARPTNSHRMTRSLVTEMLVLECLLPVVSFNLRAKIDLVVTASDACESGGGACFASRLSRMGREEAERLLEGERVEVEEPADFRDVSQVILIISLFSGIGGLEEAMRVAGMVPRKLLMVEKDPDCRRLLRRMAPGSEILSDVTHLNKEKIRSFLGSCPEASGVVVAGGSPCQAVFGTSAPGG